MTKERKQAIAYEALMILIVMGLLSLITRLWPILLFIILAIVIAAVRLLFLGAKQPDAAERQVPDTPALPPPPQIHNEQDLYRVAYGLLQRRITEELLSQYPDVRWIWEASDAMEQMKAGGELTVLLNRAGGYRKAYVTVRNLQFAGLSFMKAEAPCGPAPPSSADADDGEEPKNYELVAYSWVDQNILRLNNLCQDAIADRQENFFVSDADLPEDPESWPVICEELVRRGFSGAEPEENGILINSTLDSRKEN